MKNDSRYTVGCDLGKGKSYGALVVHDRLNDSFKKAITSSCRLKLRLIMLLWRLKGYKIVTEKLINEKYNQKS